MGPPPRRPRPDLRHRGVGGWGHDHGGDTSVFAGVEVRPFYPALTLQGFASGRERLDLFLQSLFFELGAAIYTRGQARAGLAWGAGLEIPLVTPRQLAQGVWLRLAVRRRGRAGSARRDLLNERGAEWIPYAGVAFTFGAGEGRTVGWEPQRYR